MREIKLTKFDKIQIPAELDDVIHRSLKRAAPKVKARYYRICAGKIISSLTAIFITFIIGLNTSPVFADAVIEKMPLLSALIIASKYDKGLDLAIKNDFISQKVVQCNDKGIELSIQDVIADERQVTFSYKIQIKDGYENYTNIFPDKFIIKYPGLESGENVSFPFKENKQLFMETRAMEGIVQFQWDMKNIPDSITITCPRMVEDLSLESLSEDPYIATKKAIDEKNGEKTVKEAENSFYEQYKRSPYFVDGNWTLSLDLSEVKKLAPEFYKNITAEIGQYKFHIESANIYPSFTEIKMTGGEAFRQKWESAKTHLADENGTIYQGTMIDIVDGEENVLIRLESCYFSKAKELYLVIEYDDSSKSGPIRIRIY